MLLQGYRYNDCQSEEDQQYAADYLKMLILYSSDRLFTNQHITLYHIFYVSARINCGVMRLCAYIFPHRGTNYPYP